jgi:hypothetical protein
MRNKLFSALFALSTMVIFVGSASAQQAQTSKPTSAASEAAVDPLDEIVVNGIRRGDLILPTSETSSSAYGLDLNVMDTPRNNTVLTHAQLDALNIRDPQEFSYLTSSSYTDASYGVPNVPRIRGQYGDIFFNGMRDSFTTGGYGAPLSFNSFDTLDIVKGPASVQAGPGQGVGGAVDVTTKTPSFFAFSGAATAEFDTLDHRRWSVDVGGPISGSSMAYRLSYSGEQSNPYYYGQFFDEHSIYGVLVDKVSDRYTIQLNSELAFARFTESDGINRVSQQLIDNNLYLTGGLLAPIQSAFLNPTELGNPVALNPRINIDEAPGTESRSLRYNAQAIQTFVMNPNTTLVNNTFFNFVTRYDEVQYYYADSSKNSYTIENKTDLKLKFDTPVGNQNEGHGLVLSNSMDAGATFRLAHVNDIISPYNEPVGTYDLSQNPTTFAFPPSLQVAGGGIPYIAPFGHLQYGLPARDSGNASIISDLYDVALFFEHRVEITPKFSALYGLRGDLVHLHEADPLGADIENGLPRYHSTAWYGLRNGNVSFVYQYAPWGSAYVTYNNAQYTNPTSNDGGVGTFGVSDSSELRQETRLYEGGFKFNLLDKSLFASTAIFKQSRSIPVGLNGTKLSFANINGIEAEVNYQPKRSFFATASYSYIRTRLDTAASFYNYPAEAGANIDGAGNFAVFLPNQHFNDPGVPEHLFNFLGNYRFDSGLGVQGSVQVTGPIETTTSGRLDLVNSQYVPASIVANGGYYQSPRIPWQHTVNLSVFYDYEGYEVKLSGYNITNQHNWVNDAPYFGNDFITRAPPFSVGLTLKAKFR